MKLLVTGGCGFIGSNFLVKQIFSYNNTILNIDKLTYAGLLENVSDVSRHPNYKFIKGDICDYKLITNSIDKFEPDAIIHFAAESHVDRSIDKPLDFISTNVLGTAVLLTASTNYWRENSNKSFKFLQISTDEVYGSIDEGDFFTEKTPLNPSSPYSASKAGADHLVRAWHNTYGLPTLITNCSNNYGPFQFPEKLIPVIIDNCLNEKELPVYGKGDNVRDWLFVEDHCEAIHTVLNKGVIGETYNIGGNNEIRNIDVVMKLCSILDKIKPRKNGKSYKSLISYVEDRPGHDFRYAIDASKIRNELGWNPKETFDSGITKTIEWYIENEDWWEKIKK